MRPKDLDPTNRESIGGSSDPVDRAVDAWIAAERTAVRRLGDTSRRAVIRAALEAPAPGGAFVSGRSIKTWAIAGVLPVAFAVALIVSAVRAPVGPVDRAGSVADTSPAVRAMKVDGEVVFAIANGGRPHTVYKSVNPVRFDREAGVVVRDGAYVDRSEGDADLVFYKFD